jgi:hypothetical protein
VVSGADGTTQVYACTCPGFKFHQVYEHCEETHDDPEAGFERVGRCKHGNAVAVEDRTTDDREADTVYAYATRVRGTSRWPLRWVSCEECGPPGDDEDTDDKPGETVAKATLTYDRRIDGFALDDPGSPDRTGGNR